MLAARSGFWSLFIRKELQLIGVEENSARTVLRWLNFMVAGVDCGTLFGSADRWFLDFPIEDAGCSRGQLGPEGGARMMAEEVITM